MNKFSLTILASLMITACSGGGGGSSNTNKANQPKVEAPKVEVPKIETPKAEMPKSEVPKVETPKAEMPKSEVPKVETPKAEMPNHEVPKVEEPKAEVPPPVEMPEVEAPKVDKPLSDIKETSSGVVFNSKDFKRSELSEGENRDYILVDGKEIPFNKDLDPNSRFSFEGHFDSCCHYLNDLKVGFIQSDEEDPSEYFYYNGTRTKDMPISGQAVYNGEFAIKYSDIKGPPLRTGFTRINVDFGNKSLNGELLPGVMLGSENDEITKPHYITIKADISGNRFNGKAESADLKSETKVEGGFYGKDAVELGGALTNGKDVGVFGAKKQ